MRLENALRAREVAWTAPLLPRVFNVPVMNISLTPLMGFSQIVQILAPTEFLRLPSPINVTYVPPAVHFVNLTPTKILSVQLAQTVAILSN